jgi:lambda family phage tail tape measure protein
MAQNLARLGVVLGIDTAQFTTGLQKAKQSLSQVGAVAAKAGAVAGAALVAMTYKAMQFSDQMSDLADATGVSVAKVLQIANASQRAGGSFEDGSKALTKFVQNIDSAAGGSQQMQDAFARVGVSLKDLANLSVEQLVDKTSKGIASIGDKASQTGAKMDLFGKSMRRTDMNIFNQYIQEGTQEFEKYEASIKKAAEMQDKFEQTANKIGLTFIEKVIPSLNFFFETLSKEGTSTFAVFNGILEGTATFIKSLAVGIELVSAGIKTLSVSAQAYFGKITVEEGYKQMEEINIALKKTINQARQINKEEQKIDKPIASVNPQRTIEAGADAKKQSEMLRVAQLISEEYNRQQIYSLQQLAIKNQMIGLTQDERRIQEAINQVTSDTSRKIDEINKKREDAAGRGASAEVIAEYDKQIAKVYEAEEIFIEMTRNIEQASISAQRTFQFGWDTAFRQFAENAYNYANMAQEIFSTLTSSMTQAIDTFVETGKFSFKSFAESVIKDLIKIQLRMQMMQLFSAIGSSFGGGGGPTQLGGEMSYIGPAFANGGSPPVGVASLVGERGPELFVPNRAGTIIPNNQLSTALGGGGGTTINGPYIANMSAIDTQSGVQFLMRNKESIWSANQSASRSLPASR